MKSKMSFFDPTLLKKNVSRFAPAWALLLVYRILTGPLALLRQLENVGNSELRSLLRQQTVTQHLSNQHYHVTVLAFFAALILAALVFKYLHKTRSAYMMHAFPLRRSCLFVTNTLTGLLFWLLPALVNTLLYLAVLAAFRVTGNAGAVWAALGRELLQFLFFYGLAVFTMQLCGSTVIAVLSYLALNFLLLVLPLLTMQLVDFYFAGFDYSVSDTLLYRLAPIAEMLQEGSTSMLWVYAALGLLLLVLAWLHYRVRHVERAGDPMAFGWARVAFRLLFTAVCALGLGWALAGFFGLFTGKLQSFLPYALLGCFLGWFGASMMIERTVKVFKNRKVLLGFVACAGVLLVAVLGLKYDVLGLQRKVPETAKVESVELWTLSHYGNQSEDCILLTAPEDIDAVRDFHQVAIRSNWGQKDHWLLSEEYLTEAEVHIRYHLSNGTTLRRSYRVSFPIAQGEQVRVITGLAELYRRPDVAVAWYEKAIPEEYERVTLEGVFRRGRTGEWEELACKHPEQLRDAVLADAAAGRLPIVNFLLNYKPGTTYLDYSGYPELNLSFEHRLPQDNGRSWFSYIVLVETATATLALFE